MKTTTFIIMLIVLPIILLGSIAHLPKFHGKMLPVRELMRTDRSWRLDEITQEYYDGIGWYLEGKTAVIYSEDYPTRIDTLKFFYWDDFMEEWVQTYYQNYIYDATNQYVVYTEAGFDNFGEIFSFAQGDFEYDAQNRLIHAYYQFWDSDEMVWVSAFRIHLEYVSNTNFMVTRYERGEDGEPSLWYRQNFTWDAQGRITSDTQTISTDSLNWELTERNLLSYHPNDTTTGDIFVNSVARYMPLQDLYDSTGPVYFFGMISQELTQWFDDFEELWYDDKMSQYSYNDDDNLTQEIELVWNEPQWMPINTKDYTYNASSVLTERIESYWNGMEWSPNSRFSYMWSQATANDDNTVPVVNTLNISTAPNPFNSDLRVSISSKHTQPVKLSVYNTKGQKVREITAKTNGTVVWNGKDNNLKEAPNGIYFLKAETDSSVRTVKILKLQ